MPTDTIRNYQNDANVQVEALVKCQYFNGGAYTRHARCHRCCNNDLCVGLRAQDNLKKPEEKKATQVIYDEGHLVWGDTSTGQSVYISSSEPTPSPISYTLRDYYMRYYGTAVGTED